MKSLHPVLLVEPASMVDTAQRTVSCAVKGIEALQDQFAAPDFCESFESLVALIIQAKGRIVLAGMGKSGIIARKVTATLTSTGTPALFLHPAEAGHGDLGMITSDDIVLVFSRSGETSDLQPIVNYCKRFGVPLVAVTSGRRSPMLRVADLSILLPDVREACRNDLAPTTSTTVQLVFGDALAMALMEYRGFSADDFFQFHPKGRLGAELLKVHQIMAKGSDIPRVPGTAALGEAIMEMTRTRFGATAVVDDQDQLRGVFTDGDLRRIFGEGHQLHEPIECFVKSNPKWIGPNELASEALRRMQEHRIRLLFVCDAGKLVGALQTHDILSAGVV